MYIEYMDSPIGKLKITSSEDHISLIHFVKKEEELQLENKSKISTEMCQQLRAYFNGRLQTFDIPFHQDGTSFQQSVWNQLVEIPYAETISYLDLAHKINNPKSIRAVGTTNGKNALSIVVPCHRVIGSDGKLTGYAGGLWRKRFLIDHEMKIAQKVLTLF